MKILKNIKKFLLQKELKTIKTEEIPYFVRKNYSSPDSSFEDFLHFLNSPAQEIKEHGHKVLSWYACLEKKQQYEIIENHINFYVNYDSLPLLFIRTEKDEELRAHFLKKYIAINKTKTGLLEFDDIIADTMQHVIMQDFIKVSGEDCFSFIQHLCEKNRKIQKERIYPAKLYSQILTNNTSLTNKTSYYLINILNSTVSIKQDPELKMLLKSFARDSDTDNEEVKKILEINDTELSIIFEKILMEKIIQHSHTEKVKINRL